MYDVGTLLPVEGVDDGSTLLLSGPPMTGKRLLGMGLLAEGFDHGESTAVVSTDSSAADIHESLADVYGGPTDQFPVGVVDCIGEMQGQSELGPLDTRLNSPADLTGLGIALTELLEQLYTAHSERLRVGLFSLTTMSMYVDTEQVVRFLHVIANRIDEADGVGFVVSHSDTIENDQLQQLKSFVDGVVEFREASDGTIQIRVRGLDGGQTEWVPYPMTATASTPSPQQSNASVTERTVPESLRAVLDDVRSEAPTLTVCNYDGPDEVLSELDNYFDRHNVTVRTASLDVESPRSVALLHYGDDVLGSESVTTLRNAIHIESNDVSAFADRQTSALLTQLDQSVFGASAADKGLLVDVSHNIELLAHRNGGGRLHAGFQRFSRLIDDERTARMYRRLAAAGIDVHVYGIEDTEIDIEGVITHGMSDEEIADSWFVVYDGNGDPTNQAALLAVEIDGSEQFDGFWTYDSELVGQLDAYLSETYGDAESVGQGITPD